jgi:pimeloyl-ACP methyl ester carboxylesterase
MSITIERPSTLPAWLPTAQFPFHHQWMDVDGGKAHYIDQGFGEPVVFLHGLPTWSFVYRHLIRGLSTDYRCIAPDMIGFGLSDKPADWSYSPRDQVSNLERLLDRLELDRVTLVMQDYGVGIGTAYALENLPRIKGLVVMNGVCWDIKDDPAADRIAKIAAGACGKMLLATINNWPKIVRRTFADRSKYTEAFDRAIAGPTLNKEDRVGMWKTAKAIGASGPFFDEAWRRRKELADLPMQFIWGMKDPVYGEKFLNKWWHEFPLCPVERLASAGHLPMEEKPAEVLQVIRQFLGASPSGSYLA